MINTYYCRVLYTLIGILLLPQFSKAQVSYQQTFGTSAEEVGYGIVALNDFSTISVGYQRQGGSPKLLLQRTDANGQALWQQTLGQESMGRGIALASDGNLLVTGYVQGNAKDLLLIKIDPNGNALWAQVIGGNADEQGYSVIAYNDGNGEKYAVAGTEASFNGNQNGWLAIFNTDGSLVSQHSFGTSSSEVLRDLYFDPKTNLFIAVGESNASGTRDAWALYANPDGSLEKSFLFDGGGDEWLNAVSKGNFIYRQSSGGETTEYVSFWGLGGSNSYSNNGDTDMMRIDIGVSDGQERLTASILGGPGNDELFGMNYESKGNELLVAGYLTGQDGYRYAATFPTDLSFNIVGGQVTGKCGADQILYDVDLVQTGRPSPTSNGIFAWTGSSNITSGNQDLYSTQNTDGWGTDFGCYALSASEALGTDLRRQSVTPSFSLNTSDLRSGKNSLVAGNTSLSFAGATLEATAVCENQDECNLSVSLEDDLVICSGESATLNARSTECEVEYLWSTGETTESITVSEAGTYTVEVSSQSCGTATEEVVVTQSDGGFPNCEVEITADNEVVDDCTSALLSAEEDPCATYQWYRNGAAIEGATEATYPTSSAGEYYVEVTTENCDAAASNTVAISIDPEATELVEKSTASNWLFGQNAGIDFGTDPPSAIENANIDFQGSGVSVSDADGNLLFYSNGLTVWNAENEVMDNGEGLNGDQSYTQSVIAVPKPGEEGVYYLFTNNGSLYYSEIDMSLNEGLGGVAVKNTEVVGGTFEQLASVIHDNGSDYWVLTHRSLPSLYVAVLVSAEGVSAEAVTSVIGSRTSPEAEGYFKFSANGRNAATAIYSANVVEVFDFDNSTGQLSNLKSIPLPGGAGAYGIEFSTSGSKLYISGRDNQKVYQADLDAEDIPASLTEIGQASATPADLQIGPDGRIYVGLEESSSLDVIAQPDEQGSASNYQNDALDLASGTNSTGSLPSFVQSYFDCEVEIKPCGLNLAECNEVQITTSGEDCFTYQWYKDSVAINGEIDSIFTATEVGQYYVEIDKNGRCQNTSDTINIINDPTEDFCSPEIQALEGLALGECDSEVSMGVESGCCRTFQWFRNGSPIAGETNNSLTTDQTGDYRVEVKTENCEGFSNTVTVTQITTPCTPRIESDITEFGECAQTATISTDEQSCYNYQWFRNGQPVSGATNAVYSTGQPGDYYVEVTTETCNEASETVTIAAGSNACSPRTASANTTEADCSSPAALTATGAECSTYQWFRNGQPISGANASAYNAFTEGDYYAEVRTDQCIEETNVITVAVDPSASFSVNLGDDRETCEETLTLDAGGGDAFAWERNGSVLANETGQTLQATTSGTYSVTVKRGACEAEDQVQLTFTETPVAALPETASFCAGASVTLNAGNAGLPNVSYNWNGPSGTSTQQTINADLAGTYTVTISNGACSITDRVEVEELEQPSVDLGEDLIYCEGETATITAPPSPFIYTWSTGVQGNEIEVTETGNYTATLSNGQCRAEDRIKVEFVAAPTLSLPEQINACDGETISLTAENTGSNDGRTEYTWNTGETGTSLSVTESGEYTLTAALGECSATASSTVNLISNPSVDLGEDVTLCESETFVLDAGNPGLGFEWSKDGSVIEGENGQTLTVEASGVYSVFVGNETCNDTDEVTVTVLSPPAVDLGEDRVLCEGANLTLDAGNPGASFEWNVAGETEQILNVAESGSYSVTVTAGSCSATDEINVDFIAPPSVNLGGDKTLCFDATTTLDASIPDSRATYLWGNGSTDASIEVGEAGLYQVVVSVGECQGSAEARIDYRDQITVDLGEDLQICEGESLTLDAGDGFEQYEWQDGSGGQTFEASQIGTYEVTVTDDLGCQGTGSMNITGFFPVADIDLGMDTGICADSSLVVDAGEGFVSYEWSTGETTQSITLSQAGTYSVAASSSDGCIVRDEIEITELYPLPEVPDEATYFDCDPESAILYPGSFSSYLWEDGSTDPTIEVREPRTYDIAVTNEYGCLTQASMEAIDTCSAEVLFPNAFTPTRDKDNVFRAAIQENVLEIQLTIFNRWGNVIFSGFNEEAQWDGRINGELMPYDSYPFRAEYTVRDKGEVREEVFIGVVTLIR